MNIDRWGPDIERKLLSLASLTGCPERPRNHDWPTVERELGFPLPTEYKAYADTYPAGAHRGIEVFHPEGPDGFGLTAQVRQYSQMFSGFPDARTFYPEPRGLIPWAMWEAAAGLCWRPDSDDPDSWAIVAYNDIGPKLEEVPGTTLDALMLVIRGDAARTVFPVQFQLDPIDFMLMEYPLERLDID